MDIKAIWTLIKSAASSWVDDYAPSMGAALAYYTIFSIAPLLLIIISVAGMVFGEEAARGEIVAQLQGMMGNEAAEAVEGLLTSVSHPGKGVLASIVGVLVLLIGATTVFGELQDSLDRIWRAPAREGSGLWNLLKTRVLSFGLILGVGFLLIASLVLSAGLSALGKWWAPLFGGWEVLAQVVNFVISFGLVTTIFAMIYKIMPRVKIEWHDVWIGAAVTALLFTVGKFLIGLYIGKSGVTSGFGAAGSLVVLLVWVYYSAQIFLMGAEFTWVYAHTFGSLRGQELPGKAATVPNVQGDVAGQPPAADRAVQGAAAEAGVAAGSSPAPAGAGGLAAAAVGSSPPRGLSPSRPREPAPPIKEQVTAFIRRDPVSSIGAALVSGIALRFALGFVGRAAVRRLPRRIRL